MALIFDIGKDAPLIHLRIAHRQRIGGRAHQGDAVHQVALIGEFDRALRLNAGFLDQLGVFFDERELLPRELRIALQRQHKRLRIAIAHVGDAQDAKPVVAHGGGSGRDEHVHPVDDGADRDERGGRKNDPEQGEKAAQLTRPQGIERNGGGF